MAEKPRQALEKRVQKAMLQHAVFRWESAVVIALTMLLTALGPVISDIPFWAWLIGGVIAEAALIYSSYSDPETGRKVVEEMLKEEFHPEQLHDPQLQRQMEEALDYRTRITAAIQDRRDSVLKDNLTETARQIDEWLESVYNLAKRLDQYREEKNILDRDAKRASRRTAELEKKLQRENDPEIRKQIESTTQKMQHQLEVIRDLEKTMERAQLQLETTLSSLGTIYSQTMLVGAKDIDSGRAKRLRQDINEEVLELDNILLAMDEVYESSAT